MSNTVDNRIVRMQLDNSKFEPNANQTLSTLRKLKDSLNFNSSDGLDKIENQIGKTGKTMSSVLGSAIDTVSYKFSALQVAGVTAIMNITNSALNMAKNLANSVTIAPIMSGFREYETQINATQTILANTQKEGAKIGDVNKALDELNLYADKTIYNFTEMTRNIGTFTAAGVDLKTSVSAIQGIANLAAVSGSTSQQASVAMYQLSQALATGTIRLMDWNSVVNAGMGGQVFQDALIGTAKSYGIAVDDIIAKTGSFRDSLHEGWLTADILTETLKKFTKSGVNEYLDEHSTLQLKDIEAMRKSIDASKDKDTAYREMSETIAKTSDITADEIQELLKLSDTAEDAATKVKTFSQLFGVLQEASQSGWAQSWRIIIGDYEEAKDLLTNISEALTDVINNSSNARNAVLQTWDTLSGRDYAIEGFSNIYRNISDVFKSIGESIDEYMPKITGEGLADFTKAFSDLTKKLEVSDSTLEKIKESFNGIFSAIDMVVSLGAPLINLIYPLIDVFEVLASVFLSVTSFLGRGFTAVSQGIIDVAGSIKECISGGKQLKEVFDQYAKTFDVFGNILKLFENIKNTLHEVFQTMTQGLSNVIKEFTGLDLSGILNIFTLLTTVLSALTAKTLMKNIVKVLDNLMSLKSRLSDILKGSIISTSIKNRISGFLGNVDTLFDGLASSITKFFKTLKNSINIRSLLTLSEAFALLATSLFIISTIDPEQVTNSLSVLAIAMGELFAYLKTMSAIDLKGFSGTWKLMSIVTTVFMLAGILKLLSGVGDNMGNAVVGLAAIFSALYLFEKGMSKLSQIVVKDKELSVLKTKLPSLIAIAASVYILSHALKNLSTIPEENIISSIVAMSTIFVLLFGMESVLAGMPSGEGMAAKILSLMPIALAVSLLSLNFMMLGSLDKEGVESGIKSLGTIFVALITFTGLLSYFKIGSVESYASKILGLIPIAIAVRIMASSLRSLSEINSDDIGSAIGGLEAIIFGLVGIVAALDILPEGKGMAAKILSLIPISLAISTLTINFKLLSTIDTTGTENAIFSFGSICAALVTSLGILSYIKIDDEIKFLSKILGLIPIATAIYIVSSAFSKLTTLDTGQMIKAIVSMAIVIGTLWAVENIIENFSNAKLIHTILGIDAIATILYSTFLSMKQLSDIPFGTIIASLIAMGVVMGELYLFTKGLSKVKNLDKIGDEIIIISISLLAIAAAIRLLGDLGLAGAAISLGSLALALGGVYLAVKVLAPMSASLISLARAMAIFGGGVLAFGIGVLAFGAAVTSLVAGAAALAGAIPSIMEAIKVFLGSFVDLIPMIAEIVVVFVKTLILSFSKEIPMIVESLLDIGIQIFRILGSKIDILVQEAVIFLNKLVDAIGNAVKNLNIEGLVKVLLPVTLALTATLGLMKVASMIKANAFSAIAGIAQAALVLGAIAAIIAAFGALYKIPYFKEFVEDGGRMLQAIGEAIGRLIGGLAGGIVGGASESFTNSLPQIGNSLSEFMTNLQPFLDGVSKIDGESISKVETLAKVVAALSAADFISNVSKIISLFTLESGFDYLQDELPKFADAMKSFFDEFSGYNLDQNSIEQLSKMVEAIGKLLETIPNSGGLWQGIAGGKDLTYFGSQLKLFATSIGDAVSAVKSSGVDETAVKSFEDLSKCISAIVTAAPNIGGIASLLIGDQNLVYLGGQLKLFAEKLNGFGDDIRNIAIDTEVVSVIDLIVQMISKLLEVAPSYGGLMQMLSGENNFSALSDGLKVLGGGISKYAKDVTSVDFEKFNLASDSLAHLSDSLVKMLDVSGEDFKTFSDSLTTLGKTSMDGFISSFIIGGEDAVAVVSGTVNNLKTEIQSRFSTIVSEMAANLNQNGADIINHLNWGMDERKSLILNTAKSILNKLVTTFKSKFDDFHNAGYWIMQGLAAGIRDNTWIAENAAAQAAEDAYQAAKSKLKINSPSKLTMELGRSFSEGFATGIVQLSGEINSKASNVASSAVTSLRQAISKASDIVNNDMDASPVIRPVLDLSDIEAKSGRLTSLTSTNGALRILSNSRNSAGIQNGTVNTGATYNYVQNNYSPKPLSRIDIYRQTKNQLSTLKGLA